MPTCFTETDLAVLRDLLTAHRYAFTNEAELQEGIAVVLAAAGYAFEREVSLTRRDRIDFLLAAGVGIEVKEIAGSALPVLRQLLRYAESERVSSLILVSARAAHVLLPPRVGSKPFLHVSLAGGSL